MSHSSAITVNDRVSAKTGMVAAPMNEELVMLDLKLGKYFGLDDIGSLIWQRIAEPIRVSDLCTQLMDEYDVDAGTCQADTLAFLNDLNAEGLLEVHQ